MKRNNPETKDREVVKEHQEWALEKQTEGLDPEVIKASEELEEEAKEESGTEEEGQA